MKKTDNRKGGNNTTGQPLKFTTTIKTVTVRVPEDDVDKIKLISKQMRERYLKKLKKSD